MITHSIGDQARALAARSSVSRVKSQLDILTKENASGHVADIGKKLHGNLRVLNSIETRAAAIDRYQKNASEASIMLDRKQAALSLSQKVSIDLAIPFLDETLTNSPGVIQVHANEALEAFNTVVAQMNSEVAGQSLFAGLATDRAALIPPDEILTELSRITEGKTTAVELSETVSAWFDAESGKGGYLDFAYKGTLEDKGKRLISISESRKTDLTGTASDPVIRNMLKGLAMTALLKPNAVGGSAGEQLEVMWQSGQILYNNNDYVLAEMAKVGLKQEQLENSKAENSAALAVLDIARNDIVHADPTETILALKETAAQLETMYTITGMLSKLTLTEFLR